MRILVWLLLLVFVTPITGFQSSYLLEKFEDEETCQSEATRVGGEMNKSYPGDESFFVTCRLKGTPIADAPTLPPEINKILTEWLDRMYPSSDDFRLIVLHIQKMEGTDIPTILFSVRIIENDKLIQDYLLFVSKGRVYGWSKAKFPLKMPTYEETSAEKHA